MRGFTLVELMVCMVILAILSVAITRIIKASSPLKIGGCYQVSANKVPSWELSQNPILRLQKKDDNFVQFSEGEKLHNLSKSSFKAYYRKVECPR